MLCSGAVLSSSCRNNDIGTRPHGNIRILRCTSRGPNSLIPYAVNGCRGNQPTFLNDSKNGTHYKRSMTASNLRWSRRCSENWFSWVYRQTLMSPIMRWIARSRDYACGESGFLTLYCVVSSLTPSVPIQHERRKKIPNHRIRIH